MLLASPGTLTLTAIRPPSDPLLGEQYGLKKIDAADAWEETTGSSKVVVAVIDSGIDYRHPDLYLNIWINQGEIPTAVKQAIQSTPGWDVDHDGLITFRDLNDPRNQGVGKITDRDRDGLITAKDILKKARKNGTGGWADKRDNDRNGFRDDLIGWDYFNGDNNPLDDLGHGTHVAGIIGAQGDNAVGVAGVNWEVSLMALKVGSRNGSGSSTAAARAIRYATDNGAQISNNSYAVNSGRNGDALYDAIAHAGAHGHLVIAAAGNNGSNIDRGMQRIYPAAYDLPNIISVTATDRFDQRPAYANVGSVNVDLGAPGEEVFSTFPGRDYGHQSGTSMAAPHVTGAAALLLAADPSLSVAEIKAVILESVDRVPSLSQTRSGGRLNMGRAMKSVTGDAPKLTSLASERIHFMSAGIDPGVDLFTATFIEMGSSAPANR